MRALLHRSLSRRILAVTITVFGIILLGLYLFFDRVSEHALIASEKEKAHIIAKTVAPIIGVDLYLGIRQPLQTLVDEIMKNPNITALKLTEGNRTILERTKAAFDNNEHFNIVMPVLHPITGQTFAHLALSYSNAHYQQLSRQYQSIFLIIMGVIAVISVIFSFYLRQMLLPLKQIAQAVGSFSPDRPIELPPTKAVTEEIEQISRALQAMSERLRRYDTFQKNYKKLLQREVIKKTHQLERQVRTNTLTGLPNRFSLTETLRRNSNRMYAVINIDRFGQINDLFGQDEGDRLLAEMGKVLSDLTTTGFLKQFEAYKLSADEYGIFSSEICAYDSFEHLLEHLIEHIESYVFKIEDLPIHLRITAGAAVGTDNIMEKADIALNLARAKKLSYMIYEERFQIEATFRRNLHLLHLLQTAVEEDRLHIWVQPIIDNATGSAVSYECLMRMVGDDGKLLTPERFLPFAKKARFYPRLTRTLIQKVFRFFAGTSLRFSVNLSIEDIIDPATVTFIRREMLRYNIAAQLTFELLESENIENYPKVAGFIKEMKSYGCRFAIDDFGSGYSNFEHLLHLEIDTLKIDGTLIRDIDTSENTQAVVETIVAFADKRDLICIAEFVQNASVYATVKQLGIAYSQGYYFSQPYPLEQLSKMEIDT